MVFMPQNCYSRMKVAGGEAWWESVGMWWEKKRLGEGRKYSRVLLLYMHFTQKKRIGRGKRHSTLSSKTLLFDISDYCRLFIFYFDTRFFSYFDTADSIYFDTADSLFILILQILYYFDTIISSFILIL